MSARSYEACPTGCECDDCYRAPARTAPPVDLAALELDAAERRAWEEEDDARRAERRRELTAAGAWPPPQADRPAKWWG